MDPKKSTIPSPTRIPDGHVRTSTLSASTTEGHVSAPRSSNCPTVPGTPKEIQDRAGRERDFVRRTSFMSDIFFDDDETPEIQSPPATNKPPVLYPTFEAIPGRSGLISPTTPSGNLAEFIRRISISRLMALTPPTLLADIQYRRGKTTGGLSPRMLNNNNPALSELLPSYVARQAAVLFVDISGYTLIADNLKKRYGPSDGAERLSRALNGYFTLLIDAIQSFGGDVPLFCGDAIMAIWLSERPEDFEDMCHRAVICGHHLSTEHRDYPVDHEGTFCLHLGAAAGEVVCMIVGGYQTIDKGLVRSVITGWPVLNAALGVSHAKKDEFALHRSLYDVAAANLSILGNSLNDDYVILLSKPIKVLEERPTNIPRTMDYNFRMMIAAFSCEPAIRFAAKADAVGELRAVSSVFICFYELSKTLVKMTPAEQHVTLQKHFKIIQQHAQKFGGIVNKVFQDDKGVLCLVCFGLPGCVHEDDALRSLKFALHVSVDCKKAFDTHLAIGVSRASVFLGICGSSGRHEYTVLGDSVNVAARQMGYAKEQIRPDDETGTVVCDLDTHKVISGAVRDVDFGAVGQIKVRNKPTPIPVLKPRWRDPSVNEDQATLVASIMASAKQLLSANRCSVFVINTDKVPPDMTAHFEDGRQMTISLESGIAGFVGRTGETVNIPDVYEDTRFNQSVDKATGYRTKSMLCMPVKEDEHIIAVAQLLNKTSKEGQVIPFTAIDEELFHVFSGYIAVSMRNLEIRQGVRKSASKAKKQKVVPSSPRHLNSPRNRMKLFQQQELDQQGGDGIISPNSETRRSLSLSFPLPSSTGPQMKERGFVVLERDRQIEDMMNWSAPRLSAEPRIPNTILAITSEEGTGKSCLIQCYIQELVNKEVSFFLLCNGDVGSPYFALSVALSEAVDLLNGTLSEAKDYEGLTVEWLLKVVPEEYHDRMGLITNLISVNGFENYPQRPTTTAQEKMRVIDAVSLAILDGVIGQRWILVIDGLEELDPCTQRFVLSAIQMGVPTVLTRGTSIGAADIELNTDDVDLDINLTTKEREAVLEDLGIALRQPSVYHLPLPPLSIDAFTERFKVLLKCVEIERSVVRQVHEKTHGNIGFAIDVMRALKLAQQVFITPMKHCEPRGDIDIGAVLDTLSSAQAVMVQELDSISNECRAVLRVCSVLGNKFSMGVITQCCRAWSRLRIDHDVVGSVEELMALGLLIPSAEHRRSTQHSGSQSRRSTRHSINLQFLPATTFTSAATRDRSVSISLSGEGKKLQFKRPLMKDCVYNQMLSAEREELHGVVAGVFETVYDSQIDASKVAHHYMKAKNFPAALDQLYLSARIALEQHQNTLCLQDLTEISNLLLATNQASTLAQQKEHRALYVKANCDVLRSDMCVMMLLEELELRGQNIPKPEATFALWWATLKERLPYLRDKKPNHELAELYLLFVDYSFMVGQKKHVRLANLRAVNYSAPKTDLRFRATRALASVTHLLSRNLKEAKKALGDLEAEARYLAVNMKHTLLTAISGHMGLANDVNSMGCITDTAAFYARFSAVANALLEGDPRQAFYALEMMARANTPDKFMINLKLLRCYSLYLYMRGGNTGSAFQDVADTTLTELDTLLLDLLPSEALPNHEVERWHANVLQQCVFFRKGLSTEGLALVEGPVVSPVSTLSLTIHAEYAALTQRLATLDTVVAALQSLAEIHPLAKCSYLLWYGVALWQRQKIHASSVAWLQCMDTAYELYGYPNLVIDAVRAQLLLGTRGTLLKLKLPDYLNLKPCQLQSQLTTQEALRSKAIVCLQAVEMRFTSVELLLGKTETEK